MQYALQTFYLGKVDFLSGTDVSPGITLNRNWETRKLQKGWQKEATKWHNDVTEGQHETTSQAFY